MDHYLAHISSDGAGQSILDHLQGTAALAEQFAAAFDAGEQGRLAGVSHDVGKYSSESQARLRGGARVDHATAGALECWKRRQEFAAFSVAGHHAGLPDLGTIEDAAPGTLLGRLRRAAQGGIPDYSPWAEELTLPPAVVPSFCRKDPLTDAFFTRMLYSCLVDADYLDTERFMQGDVERGGGDSIPELNRKLDAYTAEWFPPKNLLNAKRCQILQSCMQKGREKPGLFTLTVPTGGGKTVASLAFALRHAAANGLRRVIYVVPYTSIIEQTADTFRCVLGEENVLEHHSGVNFELGENATAAEQRMAHATENWDKPVVVTTAVQFFESLFANRSSACRKLHNIAGSVVVLDEAQMLPVPYLKPCVYAISQLVQHYRVSAVLCTATQPALDFVFREFLPEYRPVELCPAELARDPVFRRTRIERVGLRTWQEIAQQMNDARQILCIVNSRQGAQRVFEKLHGDGCFHLSTLMIPADRKRVLKEIGRRLDEKLPCRVVATSLIEAGVDVDFPRVLREESGLDSILQAAGRCNRNGKQPLEDSVVSVFRAEDRPPALFRMSIQIGRMAMERFADVSSSEAIRYYFQELLAVQGDRALDKRGILKLLGNGAFPFRTVAEEFRLIDDNTQTVYIPIGAGADLLKRRQDGESSRSLMRQLGQYGVSVYEGHLQALSAAGAVAFLPDGSCYLTDMALYKSGTGLSLNADCGRAEFI